MLSLYPLDAQSCPIQLKELNKSSVKSRDLAPGVNRNMPMKACAIHMRRVGTPALNLSWGRTVCPWGGSLLRTLPTAVLFWEFLLSGIFNKQLNFLMKHCGLSHLHWNDSTGDLCMRSSFAAGQPHSLAYVTESMKVIR